MRSGERHDGHRPFLKFSHRYFLNEMLECFTNPSTGLVSVPKAVLRAFKQLARDREIALHNTHQCLAHHPDMVRRLSCAIANIQTGNLMNGSEIPEALWRYHNSFRASRDAWPGQQPGGGLRVKRARRRGGGGSGLDQSSPLERGVAGLASASFLGRSGWPTAEN